MILKCFCILILALNSMVAMATPESLESSNEITEAGASKETIIFNNLLGFQEWKAKRVLEARNNLDKFKAPPKASEERVSAEDDSISVEKPVEKPESSSLSSGEPDIALNRKAEELRQLEFNLEIAQGLTIHDYFALYLKDKSKKQVEQVIDKLTADELSELLLAYRTSLYGLPLVESKKENLK